MNMPRRVGHNPKVAGEISREPEIGAAALIRCDLVWMAKVSEEHPVFASDNAIDRTGQRYCSGCGWQSTSRFGRDKVRSEKQGVVVLRRYCKVCAAKYQAEEEVKKGRKWKRHGSVKKGRPKRPSTPFVCEK